MKEHVTDDGLVIPDLDEGYEEEFQSYQELQDLYSWSSQLNFEPEMEFLEISRVRPDRVQHPQTGQPVNVQGQLERVYEPIDPSWLRERWGGGVYRIVAVRNVDGRPRRVDVVSSLPIAGGPRAFVNEHGQYQLLVQGSPPPGERPLGGTLTTAGLLGGQSAPGHNGLLDALHRQRQDPAALTVLGKMLDTTTQSGAEATRRVYELLDSAKSEKAEEIARIKEAYERQIELVKSEREKERGDYLRQMEVQRQQHEAIVAGIKEAHTESLRRLEEAAARREASLLEEARSLREDARHRETQARATSDQVWQSQVEQLRSQLADERAASDRRLSELRQTYEARLAATETRMRDTEQTLHKEMDRRERQAREEAKERLQDLRTEADRREKGLERTLPGQFTAQIESLKMERERLMTEKADLQKEVEKLRSGATPTKQLTEIAGIAKLMEDLGMTKGGTPDGMPDGWMGNVAKTIQAVAPHTIAPIMEQSRRALDIEAQKVAMMQAGGIPGSAFPPVQAPPGMRPPPQQLPGPPQHNPAQAPQQKVTLDDLAARNEEVDPLEQLVVFLAKRMEQNADPKAVAAEIKNDGAIDEEQMAALRAVPTEQIVAALVQVAPTLGHHDLTSPVGQEFLRKVHAALVAL